jgi:hypothetical protein
MKLLGMALLFIGLSGLASARVCIAAQGCPAPEMDPSAGGSALALLSGTLLILQSRRKK